MRYEMYKDAQLLWRWRLKAANNKIIADSGEPYHNKQDYRDAIDLVKSSGDAPVVELSWSMGTQEEPCQGNTDAEGRATRGTSA
jgi:uncharacterized protein YegP (UPF0339 family)